MAPHVHRPALVDNGNGQHLECRDCHARLPKAEQVDVDELTEDITVAIVEARKAGQLEGVNALRNLRSRLELVDPPPVTGSPVLKAAFAQGFHEAIQATRAEAATVLANLIRGVTP